MRHADQAETCAHDAAAILPWYVNGTLTQEERQAVEDHLAGCVLCSEELVTLLKVQAGLRWELADAPDPSSPLWGKVKGRMVAPPAATDQSISATGRPERRLAWAWLADLLRPPLRPGWALAAIVLIAVQTAVIVSLMARRPSGGIPEYRTLTGPTTPGQPSGPRVRVRVAFVEQAPEQAIRAALGQLNATIVNGPTAAGFYLIDVPLDAAGKSAKGVLQVLRGNSEVIRFAELVSQKADGEDGRESK